MFSTMFSVSVIANNNFFNLFFKVNLIILKCYINYVAFLFIEHFSFTNVRLLDANYLYG